MKAIFWSLFAIFAKVATSINAILLDSSVFWHNYRHQVNVLSVYGYLKELGVQDENIILMIAQDFSVDPRNPKKGFIQSI